MLGLPELRALLIDYRTIDRVNTGEEEKRGGEARWQHCDVIIFLLPGACGRVKARGLSQIVEESFDGISPYESSKATFYRVLIRRVSDR
jgi:hypothetical protein